MIPYHMDCLLPVEQRNLSDKFRRVAGNRLGKGKIYSLDPVYAQELVAFLTTPGLINIHFKSFFEWDDWDYKTAMRLTEFPRPDLVDLNLQRMDHETAHMMLTNLLLDPKNARKMMPHWVSRYLSDRLRHSKPSQLGKEFDLSGRRISDIARARLFNPLTLARQAQRDSWSNKPHQQRYFV